MNNALKWDEEGEIFNVDDSGDSLLLMFFTPM